MRYGERSGSFVRAFVDPRVSYIEQRMSAAEPQQQAQGDTSPAVVILPPSALAIE